jgi:hypothetical protein
MKKHCLNPGCMSEWEDLNVGDLYSLEIRANTDHRDRIRFFWLCPNCVPRFAVRLDESGHVTARPRFMVTTLRIPHIEFDLRLVMRGTLGPVLCSESCSTQSIPRTQGIEAGQMPRAQEAHVIQLSLRAARHFPQSSALEMKRNTG